MRYEMLLVYAGKFIKQNSNNYENDQNCHKQQMRRVLRSGRFSVCGSDTVGAVGGCKLQLDLNFRNFKKCKR